MLLFYFLSVASPASVGLHFPGRQDSHDTIPFQENRVSPTILSHSARFRHHLLQSSVTHTVILYPLIDNGLS